jgi:hypothetical protein
MNTAWKDHCVPDVRVFKGKRVIVRVDWNMPVTDGIISDTSRFDVTVPFLKRLSSSGVKMVLLTHFGEKGESLSVIASHVTKNLPFVTFSPLFDFSELEKTSHSLLEGAGMSLALSDKNSIIIGFHVDVDNNVRDMNGANDITVETFTVIYKITEWLEKIRAERKPVKQVEEELSSVKILKVFSTQKGITVAGGRVNYGTLTLKSQVKIIRDGEIVARGTVKELQMAKAPATSITNGNEFGCALDLNNDLLEGDTMQSYVVVTK